MQMDGITKLIKTMSFTIECQTDKIEAITHVAKTIAVKFDLFLAIIAECLGGQKNIKAILNPHKMLFWSKSCPANDKVMWK